MPQDLHKYAMLDKIPQATTEELQYFHSLAQMWKENEMCRINNPLYLLEIAPMATQWGGYKRNEQKGEQKVALEQIKLNKKMLGDKKKSVGMLYKEAHMLSLKYVQAQKES